MLTVLAALFLTGCGESSEGPPVEPSSGEPAKATPTATDAGQDDEPSHRSAAAADAPEINTQEDLQAAIKERNPAFQGNVIVQPYGRGGVAIGFDGRELSDISPLTGLKRFAGMPITRLELRGCHVTDVSPLEGLPLKVLGLEQTGVRDIGALKGMPLETLALDDTRVEDLGPLEGAPLVKLYLPRTPVTDLRPLAKLGSLESLWLNDSPVSDISPLRKAVTLVSLTLAGTNVSDLEPLKGLPRLQRLHIARSNVTDLEPLRWLSLKRLVFTPGKITKGIEHAQKMPTLDAIGTAFGEEDQGRPTNIMDPGVFWEQYDAGAFR
jgi:hypothetical protein